MFNLISNYLKKLYWVVICVLILVSANPLIASEVDALEIQEKTALTPVTGALVADCYRAFLGREPESTKVIEEKCSARIEDLVSIFLNSEEYKELCGKCLVLPLSFAKSFEVRHLPILVNPDLRQIILDNFWFSQRYYGQKGDLNSLPQFNPCGLPKEEALRKKSVIFQNFLGNFLEGRKINKIPHLHHRIWITPDTHPSEVPDEVLGKYLNGLKVFPETQKWTHFFWCLNPDRIPETIKALSGSVVPIQVRSLQDILPSMPAYATFRKLYENNYYTIASNLVRQFIINTRGGLYCDMGIEFHRDPSSLIDSFDKIFYFHREKYPDTAILAAPPSHRLERKYLQIVNDFPTFPEEIRRRYSKGTQLMYILGIPFYLTLMDSEIGNHESVLYFNNTYYFTIHRMGSWAGKPRFGNTDIHFNTLEW